MKPLSLLALLSLLSALLAGTGAPPPPAAAQPQRAAAPASPLRCAAFSPYVDGYSPNTGPHPPAALIDQLLDVVIQKLGFRCIMTYGVLNGLDYIFAAAQARGMQVIAILWLDANAAVNAASIARGIEVAQQYPDTIVRVACGSELRVRNVPGADDIIRGCLTQLRAAGVAQPLGANDTWWEWCNRAWPCQSSGLSSDVDWIGINVFPWWENKYSGLFPCTPASAAADFHLARLQDLRARYPGKEVILTEFGWPSGPHGYRETNQFTAQQCGEASEANQRLVVEETLRKLDAAGLPGVLFEAFREPWKAEGVVGPYWGACDGAAPYACRSPYGLRERIYLPAVGR